MNYLGVPFLSTNPNRVFSAAERQRLKATVMDAQTGPRTVTAPTSVPAKSRSIEVLALDLGKIYELRQHLMACQGKLKPFWVPSWQRDLVLAASSGSGVGTITIKECGYATRIWPSGAARRHLAIRKPGGSVMLLRRVTAAVSNGNGTETLTLVGPAGETTLGVAVAIDWLVMFIRYVRLDEDEIFIEWTGKAARCELPITDLVEETP
jgi:hypothetical protein